MIIVFCLFLLAAVGGVLAAMSPQPFGFQVLGDKNSIHFLLYTLKSFVVPLCLILVNWRQRLMGRFLTLVWAGWILALSCAVFLTMNESVPSIALYGVITLTSVSILALATIVFVTVDLNRQAKKETPAPQQVPVGAKSD